jgi:hypothetical protein
MPFLFDFTRDYTYLGSSVGRCYQGKTNAWLETYRIIPGKGYTKKYIYINIYIMCIYLYTI